MMNLNKIKEAETRFLQLYPGGFNNPEIIKMGKKYRMNLRIKFCQENFALNNFANPRKIVDNIAIIVGRSALVSMFEKAKFKDLVKHLADDEIIALAKGLEEMLHGNQKKGFEQMVEVLAFYKLAKWTLITLIPSYYNPKIDAFVKPTTAKNIINYMDLDDIKYSPKPSYEFYTKFRNYVNEMKKHVDESLSPSNIAFTGFMMMSM